MGCAMGCVASCRGVEVLQARTHLCCCSGWRVLLGVGRPAHSCARKHRCGSGCCARVRVRVPPKHMGRRAWGSNESEGGRWRGAERAYALLLALRAWADACALECGRACMHAHECAHERPITSCVVGLASAGMAEAPSSTGRQGRVSLCGVWGGRTVLGCWGGWARVRGGSRAQRWQV